MPPRRRFRDQGATDQSRSVPCGCGAPASSDEGFVFKKLLDELAKRSSKEPCLRRPCLVCIVDDWKFAVHQAGTYVKQHLVTVGLHEELSETQHTVCRRWPSASLSVDHRTLGRG